MLTPHSGELGRLLGVESSWVDAHRLAALDRAVERFGCVVLLKGAGTIVGAPGHGGRLPRLPSLATAGTGDVLTGIVGAFLAKGMDARLAAAAARPRTRTRRWRTGTPTAWSRATWSRRFRACSVPRSEVTIDLGALRRNAARLREVLGGAELWAVVKADGYGHGAADVARAASDAGATALCVATVAEGLSLRRVLPDSGSSCSARPAEVREAREARLELVVGDGPIPDGRARARQARHRHGPLRLRALPELAARTSSG